MKALFSVSRLLAIALLAGSAAACTTTGGGYFTPVASTDAADLTPVAASAVAGDMVARLAEHVGPGTGTIVLQPDESAFGFALQESLQGWGYAVAIDQEVTGDNPIPLAYVIDTFEGSVMTRISTPTVELTRSYAMTASGASPTSPLSVLHRTET
ncbi:conjugal transfer protein TrbH [Pelagibacterium halotolerans]|uniref:conjugal transfer protein TrbH n=1 Tax=Pelagibacterium halotolerans TaxID=531813 RepID=UPI00384ED4BB